MPEATFTLLVDAQAVEVLPGTTVAAALLNLGVPFRKSVTGEPRSALCGMGVCFECRVTIDGMPHQRSCQLPCRPGMQVQSL